MTRGEKPFLTLQGLSKSFGAVKVVANLDIEVRKGEFISLLGPSGCGKTTTLRMVAGFVSPDAGTIILEGQRIDQMPSHKRGTAMVFQNYALFPHMTVAENIAFGLRMHKVPKPEITRRVGEALDLIRLRALESRFPKELSGGQQQRVALARAIVLNPKILLLDEPLSNLDAKLRKELRAEFLEIHRVSGITTLFVTHDLEEAFSVSDRVAVMNQGRIEQYAPPVEIFTKPQTPFVAEFIGHSNVISGTLKVDGGEARLVSDGIQMAVKADGAPGRAVRVAIPSHLIRIALSRLPLDNSFEARLRSVVYLGAMLQIEAEIGSIVLRAEVPANTDTLVMKIGDAIFVGWQRGDAIELPMATV